MEDKSASSVIEALKEFIRDLGRPPRILQSDQDASYLSRDFLSFIRKADIAYMTVSDNNHHVLGIINRFIRTIRDNIDDTKEGLITPQTLRRFVNMYNTTPHSALEGSTPSEITPELEQAYIERMKKKTDELNQKRVLIPTGARVRVAFPSKTFEKRRSRLSKVAYIIDTVIGNQYQIRAKDGSIDKVPWFSVFPVEKGSKIKTAESIKASKRKQVKRILEYDARTHNYEVQYVDGSTEHIPVRNMREGRPSIPAPLERAFGDARALREI
jgi:hypothetical protein